MKNTVNNNTLPSYHENITHEKSSELQSTEIDKKLKINLSILPLKNQKIKSEEKDFNNTSVTKGKSQIEKKSQDIIRNIASFLDLQSLSVLSRTSKSMKSDLNSDMLSAEAKKINESSNDDITNDKHLNKLIEEIKNKFPENISKSLIKDCNEKFHIRMLTFNQENEDVDKYLNWMEENIPNKDQGRMLTELAHTLFLSNDRLLTINSFLNALSKYTGTRSEALERCALLLNHPIDQLTKIAIIDTDLDAHRRLYGVRSTDFDSH